MAFLHCFFTTFFPVNFLQVLLGIIISTFINSNDIHQFRILDHLFPGNKLLIDFLSFCFRLFFFWSTSFVFALWLFGLCNFRKESSSCVNKRHFKWKVIQKKPSVSEGLRRLYFSHFAALLVSSMQHIQKTKCTGTLKPIHGA